MMIFWVAKISNSSHFYLTYSAPARRSTLPPLASLGLFFELVFPESPGEGGRPHMQGRPSRQGEEEEEGNLESEPIYQASSQRAKRQLPQHLQSGQETVVGGLRGERKARLKPKRRKKKKGGEWERERDEGDWRKEERRRAEAGEREIKGRCVQECGNNERAEMEKMTTSSWYACAARTTPGWPWRRNNTRTEEKEKKKGETLKSRWESVGEKESVRSGPETVDGGQNWNWGSDPSLKAFKTGGERHYLIHSGTPNPPLCARAQLQNRQVAPTPLVTPWPLFGPHTEPYTQKLRRKKKSAFHCQQIVSKFWLQWIDRW